MLTGMAPRYTVMVVLFLVLIPLKCSSRSLPNNEAPLALAPQTLKLKRKTCVLDSDCFSNMYCTQLGQCKDCLNCGKIFNRQSNPGGCVTKLQDCGDCYNGYIPEENFGGILPGCKPYLPAVETTTGKAEKAETFTHFIPSTQFMTKPSLTASSTTSSPHTTQSPDLLESATTIPPSSSMTSSTDCSSTPYSSNNSSFLDSLMGRSFPTKSVEDDVPSKWSRSGILVPEIGQLDYTPIELTTEFQESTLSSDTNETIPYYPIDGGGDWSKNATVPESNMDIDNVFQPNYVVIASIGLSVFVFGLIVLVQYCLVRRRGIRIPSCSCLGRMLDPLTNSSPNNTEYGTTYQAQRTNGKTSQSVEQARPDNETPQQRSDSTGGSSSDSIRGVSSVQTDSAQDVANNQEIILKDSSFHSN